MKKAFWGVLLCLTLLLFMSATAFAMSGDGTESNPYLIETEEDFLIIANFPAMHYKLNNDVTINSELGDFSGIFDGNGFKITTSKDYVLSSNSGTIKNVVISGSTFVYTNNGSIKNIIVDSGILVDTNNGTIEKAQTSSGILVHTNNETGIIRDCKELLTGIINVDSSSLKYDNDQYYSMQISMVIDNYGEITDCLCVCDELTMERVFNDSVGGSDLCLAGISIKNYGIIQNSACVFNNATIIISDKRTYPYSQDIKVGGIALYNTRDATIRQCFTEGNFHVETRSKEGGTVYVGGIAYQNGGVITESYYNADCSLYTYISEPRCIEQNFYAIGKSTSTTSVIENCYSKGTVHSTSGFGIMIYATDYSVLMGGITDDCGVVSNCHTEMTFDYRDRDYTTIYPVGGSEVFNSYYLSESPSTDDSTYGIPASSGAMKLKDLYTDWDFDTVWAIDSEINDGYPYLRWEYSEDDEEPETPTEPEEPAEPETPVVPDENAPTVKVESVKGKAGGTVTVPLYIENNTGIAGMQLSLTYDERLTLTGMARSTGEEDSALESLSFTVPGNLTATTLTLPWYGLEADSTNGKILVLTFTIPEGAEDDTVYDIAISYEQGGIYDNDLNDVDFEMVNGSITVKNCTIGDINDDGLINTKDITLLSRGIAGGYGVTLTESADVNGDGLTNTKDITILSRYIAGGYGVTLGN